MSRPRRAVKTRRNYAKKNRFGFEDSSDASDEVLEVTDPNSNEFDKEVTNSATEEIGRIIDESIEKDQRTIHELQGARPKSKGSHESNRPQRHQSNTTQRQHVSSAPAKPKSKVDKKVLKTDKVKKEKGEININVLRQNKSLCKFVESQLCELLQGKLSSSTLKLYDSEADVESDLISSSEEKQTTSKGKKLIKKNMRVKSDIVLTDTSDNEFVPSSSSHSDDYISKNRSSRKSKMSGMVKKASDDVVNPQIWPHSLLQYEYVNKDTKYQDLDFRLFVAGELEIITTSKIKQSEKTARLSFLKKIVYYSGIYQWKALLDFYAAFVRQIETGQKS